MKTTLAILVLLLSSTSQAKTVLECSTYNNSIDSAKLTISRNLKGDLNGTLKVWPSMDETIPTVSYKVVGDFEKLIKGEETVILTGTNTKTFLNKTTGKKIKVVTNAKLEFAVALEDVDSNEGGKPFQSRELGLTLDQQKHSLRCTNYIETLKN